jgi:hypothetical protein
MAQYTIIGLGMWLGVAVSLGIVFALLNPFRRKPEPVKDPKFFKYEPISLYKHERKHPNPYSKTKA